jgi:hypothetical protein
VRREPYDDPAPPGSQQTARAVLYDDRGWLIPVKDLLATSFRLNALAPPDEKEVGGPAPTEAQQNTVDTDALRVKFPQGRVVSVFAGHATPLKAGPT